MENITFMSASDIARKIKAKEVSPVEVMEHFCARIEKRNASINAIVDMDIEGALAQAKEAEKKLMAGEAKGAFFGIPSGAKDFTPVLPGWKGSFGGIPKMAEVAVDPVYSTYTKAMTDAGAIFVGKTNSPALAFRGTCDNKLYGPTSTPFKVGYNSGGSSGGSAAAVADGLLPIAEGSDGGGSIRIPAAWCGIVGFKTSLGLVTNSPRPNGFGTSHPFCFNGAQTRTIEDAARVVNEMAYWNPGDPFSIDWGKRDFTEALGTGIEGKRIGFTPDFGLYAVDSEVAKIVERAAYRLQEAGAIVEPLEFNLNRNHMELAEAWCRLVSIVGMESFEGWKAQGIDLIKDYPEDLNPELIYWTLDAYGRTYKDLNRDDAIRTEVLDAMVQAFSKYDYIVSPTNACNPVKNDPNRNTVGPREINGEPVEPLIGWCLTYFCNFTGHPAISVPAGFSEEGFPVGMQIIGSRFDDMGVLSAAAAFEKIQPWIHTYEERVENRAL